MTEQISSQISSKASFEKIRYAQLWEDADVLVDALGEGHGKTFVSICSAGDNALAMLLLDPARVVVVDLSKAQLACLFLRIKAYQELSHREFLQLLGARASNQRGALLDRCLDTLEPEEQRFWQSRRADVILFGVGGVGKFENYFRLLRKCLALVHSRKTIDAVFEKRPRHQRAQFVRKQWFNWRWKILLKLFFSNRAMGLLGRDPAFFDHVEGSLAEHVERRISHAAIDLDPSQNPYLHWILKGHHGSALPLAWRAENFELIGSRLDRLDLRHGSLEAFTQTGEKADGFNLSDIFEYMDEPMFSKVYGGILDAANPSARLVYWNMMVPRLVPIEHQKAVTRLFEIEQRGKARDKAFFYSNFIVAQKV